MIVHVSSFGKLKWQVAWAISWCNFSAELYSEDAPFWFHIAAIEQLDVSISSYRLTLIWNYFETILNCRILNLLSHVLEGVGWYDSEQREMPSLFEQLFALIGGQHFFSWLLYLDRWWCLWCWGGRLAITVKSLHLRWIGSLSIFGHLHWLIFGESSLVNV